MRPLYLLLAAHEKADHKVEQLISEMKRHTSSSIVMRDDDPTSVVDDALFIHWHNPSDWVSGLIPSEREHVLRRSLVLNGRLQPGVLLEAVDQLGVAGGVPSASLLHLEQPTNQSLCGLRSVVKRLDAIAVEGRYANERYCYYRTPEPQPIGMVISKFMQAVNDLEDELTAR